jgi:hypothetical protein
MMQQAMARMDYLILTQLRVPNNDSPWQKLHSHAYTHATVCSFVSFTYYLSYLRRWIAKKIHLWCCLLHHLFPSHSW